jgi:hypothetical protein
VVLVVLVELILAAVEVVELKEITNHMLQQVVMADLELLLSNTGINNVKVSK